MCLVGGLSLPLPHFLVGTYLFVLVYDLFVDSGESNVLWLFFWLVVLSLYSTALMFTFNEQRDLDRRLDYAAILAQPRDTVAEPKLHRLVQALRSDAELQSTLARTDTMIHMRELAPVVERALINEAYLHNHYSYRIFGYDEALDTTFIFGRGTSEARQGFASYQQGTQITEHLRYYLTAGKPLHYVLRLPAELNPQIRRELFIELVHAPRSPSRVFVELLVEEPYRHLQDLQRYAYAIYRGGDLVEQSGVDYPATLRLAHTPAPGESSTSTDSEYSQVLYQATNDHLVLIGKDMGGYWRPMSLFSALFVICIFMTLVMSLLNTFIDLLPQAIDITWIGKPDLKTKIQVGIIALVLLSFGMIGYVTVLYFHESTDAYHDRRLNRKVASIQANIEHELGLLFDEKLLDAKALARIVKPISEIHHMDVNLFDLKGNLSTSSETDIYTRGIIAPKMSAFSYQMLSKRSRSLAVERERIGDLDYLTAYVPIHTPDEKVVGYLGLPYYSKQRDLRDDVSSFMGTLLNVYVFLLLIAGGIAISVANSITRPLSELGAKIRRFKVDDRNEPLEWKARDELGALISEFNSMLSTVQANALELDNARRDAAWREMAQQVAHEIKNPLTPIKLQIQYLKLAHGRDPLQVGSHIERVSRTIVEQIDVLESIASNFSTFARMPAPDNSCFDLDDLVRSSFEFFADEPFVRDLSITPDSYPVLADQKLLRRVLNNLIKNAIQAIPEDRQGSVSVSLQLADNKALIAVRDNGTGIPEEMREKVFYPKFTTKSSGSGLGLAMCRDIITASNGRIFFETRPGEGTDFFVELPLVGEMVDLEVAAAMGASEHATSFAEQAPTTDS